MRTAPPSTGRTCRTYWLLCGNANCEYATTWGTAQRPDFAVAGSPVRDDELVDGEVWMCHTCQGRPEPEPTGPWRDHWLSWFVDGHAVHFRADSPTAAAIAARLAELDTAGATCAAPDCDEPVRRRGQRFCSRTCAQRARRVRARAAERSRIGVPGRALPDPLESASPEVASPQVDAHGPTPVIAHTAHGSGRVCANCGRDISDRRADARVCGNSCRMALTRRARTIAAQADLFDLLGQPPIVDVDTRGRT